jgi:hypothetical protein
VGRDDGVHDISNKKNYRLQLEPAATTLASGVPLHGGIAEECQHLPSLLALSPDENQERGVQLMIVAFSVSCLP